MFGFIAAHDHSLMRRVHKWHAPHWVRLWMICATRGGDGWLWFPIAAAVLLFGGSERFRAIAAAARREASRGRCMTILPGWGRRRDTRTTRAGGIPMTLKRQRSGWGGQGFPFRCGHCERACRQAASSKALGCGAVPGGGSPFTSEALADSYRARGY